MINSVKTNKGEFVLVEVEKESENFSTDTGLLLYYFNNDLITRYIPDGSYTFLCTTDTITEDIANGIVEENNVGYINYEYNVSCGLSVNYQTRTFQYALRSFKSLLASHNLSPEKTYAICRKID